MHDRYSRQDDQRLEQMFAASRAKTPQPDEAFMARLADDANAHVPKFQWATPPRATSTPLRGLQTLFAAAGLAGSAALGIWIGFVSPDLLNDTLLIGVTNDELALSDFFAGADLSSISDIGADG